MSRGLVVLLLAAGLHAQNPAIAPGETFGDVTALGGTPDDVVLDESRGRLYLVMSATNRVLIFDYREGRVRGQVAVGAAPVSAAISPDSRHLYVTNVNSASLSIIDLNAETVTLTVSLAAKPEGVAAGIDGRVLITTQGTGANNALNTLLLYDPTQPQSQQVTPVPTPLPLSTPAAQQPVTVGRPTAPFPGRLLATPDGLLIAGMVALNQLANNAQTILFVYEVASGTVIRNRTVTGNSTVLSISPDGARFMAGATLYDTATLAVIGQQNTANLPFLVTTLAANPAVNVQQNYGGSAFLPDGQTLLSAFNLAANNIRPLAQALFVSDPRNLGVHIGLRLPESILGRMVTTSDGREIWASSESGLIHLPMGRLFEYPIIEPDTNTVFLAVDECNKGVAKAAVRIHNAGSGRLTFSVPNVTAALVTQVTSGLAPAAVTFIMEPGRSGVVRRPGTNLFTGATNGNGLPINVNLSSREAVNFPPTIRVFMNFRERDQRGVVFPIPASLNAAEGLHELILDEPRGLVYISNSGFNRIELFDTRKQRFLNPIRAGQFPRSMAMSVDGRTLYVGNSGGESITIVDLDTRRTIGEVEFPAIPRAGNQAPVRPLALAHTLNGLQFVMSNGGLWKLIGSTAVPRPGNAIINPNNPAQSVLTGGVYYISSSPGGEYAVILAGNGNAYLYDAYADSITAGRQVLTTPIQSYFGPAGAAPRGGYYLVNGLILSPALAIVGGAERPAATQQVPGAGGAAPTQQVVSTGTRHVTAVSPIDENTYLRMTMPVRQNLATATRDDPRATLEMVDVRTGAETILGIAPDNPTVTLFGSGRTNVPARQLAVDSQGNAYAITRAGLSIVPLSNSRLTTGARPAINAGSRAILNANDGT
ncbi:MAG: YncE family protein, partial [Bryobacteraceae bacterium]